MPTGTGLDSQLGAKRETTYGTRAVPDHFFEFRSESLSLEKNFLVSQQLGAGSTFARGSRRVATTRAGAGNIVMEATNQGMGFWFDLMHDGVVTPTQIAATPAYLQTHNIGLTTGAAKSATIQVGRPSTDGTVRPFDYLGCMVTGWSMAWDDYLLLTLNLDAQEEKTDQTLATRSLPSALKSFVFTQGSLTIGGVAVADVSTGSMESARPMQTDFYPLGSSGLKSRPVPNGFASANGTLNARFTDLTHYARFTAGTRAAVVLTFTGDVISGANFEQIKITMADVGFNGETPNVDGPEVLDLAIPFSAFYDGTNAPVKIEYVSTDTTL